MNVFGIGLPEIAVIGALALLVFGPKRLPELGRSLGKTLKGFQAASTEFEREIQKAMAEPESQLANEQDPDLDPSETEFSSKKTKNSTDNPST